MRFTHIALIITSFIFSSAVYAQDPQQQEKQKTPVEIAEEQTDKLTTELSLNGKQIFQVDSILQSNFTGVATEFEKLRKTGILTNEAYIQSRENWQTKTEDALKKILSPDQFKKYMIYIGKMDRKGRLLKKPKYRF